MYVLSQCLRFRCFLTSLLPYFLSQGRLNGSMSKHFGHQMQQVFRKMHKIKTAIYLERGHQNQALQGLCFNMLCHLLMHVIKSWTIYYPSHAQFTFSSIYELILPSFWIKLSNNLTFEFQGIKAPAPITLPVPVATSWR